MKLSLGKNEGHGTEGLTLSLLNIEQLNILLSPPATLSFIFMCAATK
jgi:hypothetical protein